MYQDIDGLISELRVSGYSFEVSEETVVVKSVYVPNWCLEQGHGMMDAHFVFYPFDCTHQFSFPTLQLGIHEGAD